MRKLIWLLLAAALTLSACASGQPATLPQATATEVVIRLPETPTPAPTQNCTSIKVAPTPSADEKSLFPPVSAEEMVSGAADAVVTIVEYGDYQ